MMPSMLADNLGSQRQLYPYKEIIIVYIVVRYFFQQYINIRQFNNTLILQMPDYLRKINIRQESFLLSQAYANDKITFQMLTLSIRTCLEVLIIMTNVRPFIWDHVHSVIFFININSQFERALGYWLVYALISKTFMVPFELYEMVIIQRKHRRLTKTISNYVFDILVQGFLYLFGAAPVIYGYLRVVEVGGEYFYIFLQVIILMGTVVYAQIFPFVTKYFNKFKNIQSQDLQLKIKNLITKTRFPLGDIKIKINNEHDTHGAEYMGIGKSHFIAIYQSLTHKLSHQEIIAVLAHEIGHWHHSHSLKSLCISLIQNISIFYIYSFFVHNEDILISFGFRQKSVFMGTALFYQLLTPLTGVFYYWNLAMKRRFQFQSDGYASFLGHGQQLKDALVKFYAQSAPMIKPDIWYSRCHLTHPSLHERIEHIDQLIWQDEEQHKHWMEQKTQ